MSIATTESARTVEETYSQLLDAVVAEDAERLEQLLTDDCVIVGPKGFCIDKDEWIGVHSSRIYEQVELRSLESAFHRHHDTIVRTDLQRSECIYQGERIFGLYRVLSVWTRRERTWQLAAIQYTAVAPEAQAEGNT